MQAVGSVRVDAPLAARPVIRGMGIGRLTHGDHHITLPSLWGMVVTRYHMLATIGGVDYRITPGHLLLMPPGMPKIYRIRAGEVRHIYTHFELPGHGPAMALPVVTDLAGDTARIERDLDEALPWFHRDRERCAVRIWDVLHRLRDALHEDPGRPAVHPAVVALEAAIERELDSPLTIAALADRVGLSHGHLATLFRRQRGTTIVAWIRRRRLERARHLLLHTTAAVKDVAAQVGMPDLQTFNKAMRAAFGCGPRELRRRATGSG